MIHFTKYENNTTNQWVTFVHGAGGSSSIWFKQIRDFKKHYNVLLLDLRGHGDSKNSQNTSSHKHYTFPALANDIIEVLDYLKIQKSHFVGISLGTILIRQLAESYPNKVQSMILGGANAVLTSTWIVFMLMIMKMMNIHWTMKNSIKHRKK